MLDYPAARAVAMVAQTGSFEKAAQALHVTPSAVSQRIKHLEERLGVVLIARGNPCAATEQGEWLCRHMEHVGMLEQELVRQLPGLGMDDAPQARVTLSVAVNSDSLATWFVPAMAAFTETSDILLNIAIEDQDHTKDWLENGRVLAAVTTYARPVRGCQVIPLGTLRYATTASPAYMARHFPDGVTPEALSRAPALTFNQKDSMQSDWARGALGHAVSFPTHWMASTHSFIDACVAGVGWGLHPVAMIADHLAAGRLVELVPGHGVDMALYWQINRLAAPRLSALTRHVRAAAGAYLIMP
ncbi:MULTISPECIES: LysR family transcriptional regulator ArgP [Asticcacaulis]|uniref:LysR family transcriptional regulator ArgP n=1 Tax=Asticcacaulis TaxID=76890 RepID=UPI001AE9B488|nr:MULTISPECIES: LysR family transcriptional regulator ArgP [Asticcacaulis]MBP2161254.1 LysR family transcriptional regulator (chromosome initiation inhibitor) [Asticcacaulis solisilvae]MDR6802380.1 LysR family transcriptional regulator (chromosome initiation inhibitor) [Asticcacaulis sp. BE141]